MYDLRVHELRLVNIGLVVGGSIWRWGLVRVLLVVLQHVAILVLLRVGVASLGARASARVLEGVDHLDDHRCLLLLLLRLKHIVIVRLG